MYYTCPRRLGTIRSSLARGMRHRHMMLLKNVTVHLLVILIHPRVHPPGGRSTALRHSRAGRPSAQGHSMLYLRVATMEVATETSGVAAERTILFGQETTVDLT